MTDPRAGERLPIQILHVEDEALNRELLRAILDRAPDDRLRSAQIDEASDLGSARSLMTSNPPDLVLLDVRLPDGSGLDFLREVRSQKPSPHVIVMSASVLAVERDEAIRAGCDAFLGKPYTRAELTSTLQQVLFADPEDPASGEGGPTASS